MFKLFFIKNNFLLLSHDGNNSPLILPMFNPSSKSNQIITVLCHIFCSHTALIKFCLKHVLQNCLQCLYYIFMFSHKTISIIIKCKSSQTMISFIDLFKSACKKYLCYIMRRKPKSLRVKYQRPACPSAGNHIKRAIPISSLTVRQHLNKEAHYKEVIMGKTSKNSLKKKTLASLKSAGLLDRFKTVPRKGPQPGPRENTVKETKAHTSIKVEGPVSEPQVPEASREVTIATSSSSKTVNSVTIPFRDVGNVLTKLEDVVNRIGTTPIRNSISQTESTPQVTFRDRMDHIISYKVDSANVLESLKMMSLTWPPCNNPVAVADSNDGAMYKMVIDEDRVLAVAKDMIRNVDVVKLAHFIRTSVQNYYCVHSPGTTNGCAGCKYFLSIIGSLKLLKHEGITLSNICCTDDLHISSMFSPSCLTPFPFPECPIYEDVAEEEADVDVVSEETEEVRAPKIENCDQRFPEALNLSIRRIEETVDRIGQDTPGPAMVTLAARAVGHNLPRLAPARPLGPVQLELRHVALPLPQLDLVRDPEPVFMGQARPITRANNVILRAPPRPVQHGVMPSRVTAAGAPANERGGIWTVVTGSREYPHIYNPSAHPSLIMGAGEDERIAIDVLEATRGLRRIMGSGLWNTMTEEYGDTSMLIPYVHPCSPICPLTQWTHRRCLPNLEYPSPISVCFSNRGANLNANNIDVRNRNKIIFTLGYMLTQQMPKKWKAYHFLYALYYGKLLARAQFTPVWNTTPDYVRYFQIQQINATGMFMALDIFQDLREELIMAHAPYGVRNITDILNGNFPLIPPFNSDSPPKWRLPLAPGWASGINSSG